MSYRSVLVVGDNPEAQLAPFHEFESTGLDDRYVVNIDVTQEYRERYASGTIPRYKDEKGELYSPWDDRFYSGPTPEEEKEIGNMDGEGWCNGISWTTRFWKDSDEPQTRVHHKPENFQEVECKISDVLSFAAYCIGYEKMVAIPAGLIHLNNGHGHIYAILDEDGDVIKIIRRTNPNKKWSWCLSAEDYTERAQYDNLTPDISFGVFLLSTENMTVFRTKNSEQCVGTARKEEIDFVRMRSEAATNAARKFDIIRSIIEPHLPVTSWSKVMASTDDAEDAWSIYCKQPAVKALRESAEFRYDSAEDYAGDRDEFIARAVAISCTTFSVIKDGQWYERGEMSNSDWSNKFDRMIAVLPENTKLTVYVYDVPGE